MMEEVNEKRKLNQTDENNNKGDQIDIKRIVLPISQIETEEMRKRQSTNLWHLSLH